MGELAPAELDPDRIKDQLNRICGPPDGAGLSWNAAGVAVSGGTIEVTTGPPTRRFTFVVPAAGEAYEGASTGMLCATFDAWVFELWMVIDEELFAS